MGHGLVNKNAIFLTVLFYNFGEANQTKKAAIIKPQSVAVVRLTVKF